MRTVKCADKFSIFLGRHAWQVRLIIRRLLWIHSRSTILRGVERAPAHHQVSKLHRRQFIIIDLSNGGPERARAALVGMFYFKGMPPRAHTHACIAQRPG
jgi:hypothetical protein